MIHEWREYYIVPGKSAALHERFEKSTQFLFKKHGVKVIGYWSVADAEDSKMVYLCEFHDKPHLEKTWQAFAAHPDWIALRDETEKDGPLIERIVSTILIPTSYSPLQ